MIISYKNGVIIINKILKNIYISVVIIFVIGICFNVFRQYRYDYISKKIKRNYTVIKVAGDCNFPPFEYLDEKGTYTGFNVEVMKALSSNMGVRIEFYPMKWKDACEKLNDNTIHIIQGMKKTPDREKKYNFSKPYLQNSQSIFVLKPNEKINRYEDLQSKIVAIQSGDIAISNLKNIKDVKIISTKDQEEAFNKLLKGDIDAYIGNTLTGVNYINKLKVRENIKLVDNQINITDYCIATNKNNKELLFMINNSLQQLESNGTYEFIFTKWFGYNLNVPKWYIKNLIKVSGVTVFVLLILLLIFLKWNEMLKKDIHQSTYKLKEANDSLWKKNLEVVKEKEFRENILNSINDGIITIGQDHNINFINNVAISILKINPYEVIGKRYEDTIVGSIFLIDEGWDDLHKKSIIINDKEVYISYKLCKFNNYEYENERIINFRDITEEKLIEDNIRTKDKMQCLGTLISGIAHEIRNPLTSIKTYTQIIPKKYNNSKFREMISTDIPKEIDRLNGLINDLLEYSRPRKPFKENINLLEYINRILALLNNKICKENICIDITIDKSLYVFMDKNHFKQTFINLILNAIESMDKHNKYIKIYTKVKNKLIYLYVEDNGCGISKENIKKIYNPFYTTKPSGTGLGLYVIYQLILENKVQIYLESELNKGTTIALIFKIEE